MVTAAEVKAYREKTGVGLLEARRVLEKRDREKRLTAIEDGPINIWSMARIVRELAAIVREMNQ